MVREANSNLQKLSPFEIKVEKIEGTAELQWLEQAWDHENWFQSKIIPASQGKFLYL